MTNENPRLSDDQATVNNTEGNVLSLLEDAGFLQIEEQKQNMLLDCGVIDSLAVPANWTRQPEDKLPTHPFRVDFRSNDNSLLSFREKGSRVSEAAGLRFKQSLNMPLNEKTRERQITIGTEAGKNEFAGLNPILADDLFSSGTFKTETVRIVELNGTNVLELTGARGKTTDKGEWQNSGIKVTSIYIDKFGKGDAIQEIRLEAPTDVFPKLKTDLAKSLKTIKWKK